MIKCTIHTFFLCVHLCFYFVNFSYNILTKHLITKHGHICVCENVYVCVCDESDYVILCVFFLINVDIMIKLMIMIDKSFLQEVDGSITTIFTQKKRVVNAPVSVVIRLRSFVHICFVNHKINRDTWLCAYLPEFSFSLYIYVCHKYVNAKKKDKNATII